LNKILSAAVLVLGVALVLPTAATAKSRYLQCVPFAREVSGIDIRGDAKTWWGQAAGRYERGTLPREGAVMAMPGHGKMRLGHVATISKIVNDREVLVTHANWSRRGGIERNVRVMDVSESGDWSRVKIWFAGNGDLGTTSYPVSGFIYAKPADPNGVDFAAPKTPKADKLVLNAEILALAHAEAAGR
jgi:surface antigen